MSAPIRMLFAALFVTAWGFFVQCGFDDAKHDFRASSLWMFGTAAFFAFLALITVTA